MDETIAGATYTTVVPNNYVIAVEVLREADKSYQGCYIFFHVFATDALTKMVFLSTEKQLPPF